MRRLVPPYGGNPLACAAIKKTLDLFEENHIIEHVASVGEYLKEQLEEVAAEFDCILMRRGMGLMQGLVFDKPVGPIIAKAMEFRNRFIFQPSFMSAFLI